MPESRLSFTEDLCMKFARYWPLAATAVGVGLVYVVLAQADSKTPHAPLPQPVDAVFETADAPWSPSDLPRLESLQTGVCTTKSCSTGACNVARTSCAANACPATAACTATAACPNACPGACTTTVTAFVAEPACACGTNCACTKEDCACGKDCTCGKDQEFRQIQATKFAACSEGECGTDCACPAPGACYANPVAHHAEGNACEGQNRVFAPMHVWAAPPIPPYAMQFPLPPPAFIPPPPHEHHPAMHDHLVHAMTENARLKARDEAWSEMQSRFQATAELAVENAKLKAQVELAAHKEKTAEHVAQTAIEKAALEAKLEAMQEREKLVEALVESEVERAKLEAAAETVEAQHELHTEMLGALVEARQEMFGPLHEALLENASLKAQAAAQEEVTALKAHIAELEQAVGAQPAAKTAKRAGAKNLGIRHKRGKPAAKTAEKTNSESETK
jgi:hypothetical protein